MSSIIVNIEAADFSGEGLDIIGTEGADILSGTNDGELVDGLAGNDRISTSDGDDFIIGGVGNDTLGAGAGNDTVLGGEDSDLIFAFDGDDVVNAGDGNDIIYGGRGSDILFGGAGRDNFVFDTDDFEDGSVDIIADFELGEDQFLIRGLSEDDAIAFDSTTGSISLNGEEVIRFEDVDTTEDFELL